MPSAAVFISFIIMTAISGSRALVANNDVARPKMAGGVWEKYRVKVESKDWAKNLSIGMFGSADKDNEFKSTDKHPGSAYSIVPVSVRGLKEASYVDLST